MKIIDCIQRSDEWYAARIGKLTASGFDKVLCDGTGRKTYMLKLAAERLTGISQDGYTNSAMEWGQQTEEAARNYYTQVFGEVQEVGFVEKDDWVGASPDGLIDTDGLLEIKCPNSTTHIENILAEKMPTKYRPQVQGQLWVTERQWCDFVSFDPRVQARPFLRVRIERDDSYISKLASAVEEFVKELKELLERIQQGPF